MVKMNSDQILPKVTPSQYPDATKHNSRRPKGCGCELAPATASPDKHGHPGDGAEHQTMLPRSKCQTAKHASYQRPAAERYDQTSAGGKAYGLDTRVMDPVINFGGGQKQQRGESAPATRSETCARPQQERCGGQLSPHHQHTPRQQRRASQPNQTR